MCLRIFPTFFFIRFSVSVFMWRSLIHLDLSFLQGDKNRSMCILLHANCQLSQHHLLKTLSFFHWMVLAPLSKDQLTIGVLVHLWVFNSISLIYLPVTVLITCSVFPDCSVVQLEVRDADSLKSSLIDENSFC